MLNHVRLMIEKSVLCLIFAASSSWACEITVRVPEGGYVPYFIEDNGDWTGISVDVTEALMEEAGCSAIYRGYPFSRAVRLLERGELDLVLNFSRNEEREQFAHYVGPMLTQKVVLVTRKEAEFGVNSIDDLSNLPQRISIERDFFYGDEFAAKRDSEPEFAAKLQVVDNITSSAKMLKTKRISGFFGYEYSVVDSIKNDPMYRSFKVDPFVIRQDVIYFGFSKVSVDDGQLAVFQQAYNRIVENGTLEEIVGRYSRF